MDACSPKGIQVKKQFKQVIINRHRTRLDQENVLFTDNFFNHDMGLTIRHLPGRRFA
jgi:hypothetical protein